MLRILAVSGCVLLTSCQLSGVTTGVQIAADVVNSLPLACASAQDLLVKAQPNLTSPKSVATAGKLSSLVERGCTNAVRDSTTAGAFLQLINTTAAVLLGTGVLK